MAGLGAAINTGNVGRGDSVAVFGCGGVGDAAIAGATLAGAHTIIAVDIDDRKLEWAKEFGATHTCNSKDTDPVEYIKSVTDGNGADVCIEAIGNPAVYRQAFEARDLAGTVVLVGVPRPDMTLELPFIEVFGRGGALKSSWYGDCLPIARLPDAGRSVPAGPARPRQVRVARRSRSTTSRRRSTRWSAARCSAASSCSEPTTVPIELVTTDGDLRPRRRGVGGHQQHLAGRRRPRGGGVRRRPRSPADRRRDQRPPGQGDRAHPRPQRSHQRRRAAARCGRRADPAPSRRPHAVGRRVAGRLTRW